MQLKKKLNFHNYYFIIISLIIYVDNYYELSLSNIESIFNYSLGLRGSILNNKIINNAVTVPVAHISGSRVTLRRVPIISRKTPAPNKI
jgi:hypothetical protein